MGKYSVTVINGKNIATFSLLEAAVVEGGALNVKKTTSVFQEFVTNHWDEIVETANSRVRAQAEDGDNDAIKEYLLSHWEKPENTALKFMTSNVITKMILRDVYGSTGIDNLGLISKIDKQLTELRKEEIVLLDEKTGTEVTTTWLIGKPTQGLMPAQFISAEEASSNSLLNQKKPGRKPGSSKSAKVVKDSVGTRYQISSKTVDTTSPEKTVARFAAHCEKYASNIVAAVVARTSGSSSEIDVKVHGIITQYWDARSAKTRQNKEGGTVQVPLNQGSLKKAVTMMLGVSAQKVNDAFASLKERGVITTEIGINGGLTLVQPLRNVAELPAIEITTMALATTQTAALAVADVNDEFTPSNDGSDDFTVADFDDA